MNFICFFFRMMQLLTSFWLTCVDMTLLLCSLQEYSRVMN